MSQKLLELAVPAVVNDRTNTEAIFDAKRITAYENYHMKTAAPKTNKLSTKVYEALRKIPQGKITTYKILGDYVGCRGYRAIGRILNANPDAPQTPCHRVISTSGELGGYAGGAKKKRDLLEKEGVTFESREKGVFVSNVGEVLHRF